MAAQSKRPKSKSLRNEALAKVPKGAASVALGTAAQAAAGTVDEKAIVIGLVFGGLGLAINLGIDAVLAHRKAAGERFVESVFARLERDNVTREEIKGLFESRAEDPKVAEAIFEAVKRLLDASAPEAAAPLGAMLAEYVKEQRGPDAFFRGTARLLSEINSEEFVTLRRLLGNCVEVASLGKTGMAPTHFHGALAPALRAAIRLAPGGVRYPDEEHGTALSRRFDDLPNVHHIAHLLRTYHLADVAYLLHETAWFPS